MPEDRSLDDFAGTDAAAESGTDAAAESGADAAESGADAAADAEPGDPASDDAADSDSAVDPAVATSTWHADGAACDRCGERVERRWREADAFVCADCASW